MNKKLILSLAAAGLLASCAVDEQPGSTTALSDNNTIAFNMQTASQSRANTVSGNDAAVKLGSMFIVWGEKNENQTSGAKVQDADLVFKNYVVAYKDGTASVSNTKGWEYVGVDHSFIHNSADNGTDYVTSNIGKDAAQTIKYWDDNATSYTFTAISALQNDIQNGKVIITKNPGSDATGSSTGTVYDKGYTVNVKKDASVDNIYFSDRNYVTKSTGSSSFDHSKAVSMSFRNFMSKIRFGIYETVPGYKVVITGLKYTTAASGSDNVTTHTNGSTQDGGTTFGITGNFVVPGENTTYTVTYENAQSSNPNKAKVEITGTANTQTYLETKGTNWLSTSKDNPVGTTANAPTWDNVQSEKSVYTTILPNPGNSTNLKLQVSYKLISEDTGEEIKFKNGEDEIFRTVEVPAEYCKWKSNYAYTYLFKITDKSAELNPITFDAVVVTDEIANQETITTVDVPSITTYVKGKLVTTDDEYAGGDDIYAYAQDDNVTAMSTDNMKLYKVTLKENAEGYAITEGSVDDALNNDNVSTENKKLTVTEIKSDGSESDKPSYTVIPAEDGTNRSITGMKWTATTGTTYAIEYIKGSGADAKKYYKIVKVAAATSSGTQDTQDNTKED